jgi:predicted DNA-binding transcriptional regulator YafY
MKQTDRIHFIIETLREGSQTIHELKQLIEERSAPISVRQIQRDLDEIDKFLFREEKLISYRRNYLKYYKIKKNTDYNSIHKMDDAIIETNFYEQKLSNGDTEKLEIIKNAIEGSKSIIISNLINDETGDNYNFTTTNISFIPLKIIYHRNSLYVGGYNNKKNIVQIFGINQLQNITLSKAYKNKTELSDVLQTELMARFGVSKNIDSHVYDIKIEISSVLAGFIKNHFWHHSQKYTKRNNNLILNLKCGINRELLGWLFQWMYNIRVIEPPILKEYYEKTLHEIQKNVTSKYPLVYKNIFGEIEN